MTALTYDQADRKARALQRHHTRQNRMPDGEKRLSPRKMAPNTLGDLYYMRSQRVCAEHVTEHPNDFRYLYRDTRADAVKLVWLNSAGMAMSPPFSSMWEAIVFLHKDGWEDASW